MTRMKFRLVVGAIATAIVLGATFHSRATEIEKPERRILKNLLDAVETNGHSAFIKDATPEVKAGFTEQVLQAVSGQVAPHMKKGYTLTYLGQLRQQGCEVHLWRLTYRAGHDDTLLKLVLKGGKVAGFSLQ